MGTHVLRYTEEQWLFSNNIKLIVRKYQLEKETINIYCCSMKAFERPVWWCKLWQQSSSKLIAGRMKTSHSKVSKGESQKIFLQNTVPYLNLQIYESPVCQLLHYNWPLLKIYLYVVFLLSKYHLTASSLCSK